MDLEVLKIAADTDNNRNIEKKTHISKLKNSLCGDEMQIELLIKNKNCKPSSKYILPWYLIGIIHISHNKRTK